MPFGSKSAQEVFQKRISQHFGGLEGIKTDIYYIIVHADTEIKHDRRLSSVLDQFKNINLTLNKDKLMHLKSQGGDLHWSQTHARGDEAR